MLTDSPESEAPAMSEPMTLVVVGSIHLDRFAYLAQLPAPGETVIAQRTTLGLGGKGANQAFAAARSGADVCFVGATGADDDGDQALGTLAEAGVDVSAVVRSDAPTGTAFVLVDSHGENCIVVTRGANDDVSAERVLDVIAGIGPRIVLSQGELPVEAIEAGARAARSAGARFVLNLAPYHPLSEDVLAAADPLIVNEPESIAILGDDPAAGIRSPEEAMAAAMRLATRVSKSAVVTIGAGGAAVSDGSASWHVPALRIDRAVDTTGAGDIFTGVLVAGLAHGLSLSAAVQRGVIAGGLAVTREGTIAASPTNEEITALMPAIEERTQK